MKRLLSIALLVLVGCREEIVHNLSEHEANRLRAALHVEGIESEKVRQPDGNWALAVDENETLLSLQLLESRRLLRGRSDGEAPQSHLFMSRREREVLQLKDMALQIEETLTSVPGVLEARVHLYREERDVFQRAQHNPPISASVFVLIAPDKLLVVDEVRDLVSGATGSTRDRVSVMLRYGETPPNSIEQQPLPIEAPRESAWRGWWSQEGILLQIGLALIAGGIACMWMLRSGQRPRLLKRTS